MLGGVGCGRHDATESDVPYEALRAAASAALTTQGCTTLPVSTVRAIGDDGNVPGNTLDDRLDTRWSSLGKGSWLDYDLGAEHDLSGSAIAWHNGHQRTNDFTLSVSSDGQSYTQVYSGRSSGTTMAAETYTFTSRPARYLRITVNGNSINDWASIAEARVCARSAPGGGGGGSSVVWRGDFETGDRSQWTREQMVSANRLQVVTSPVREGRHALKATVQQGDDPINSSGNRNELVYMSREPVGSEYYYRWSTMFAPDFPSAKTWQLVTQWHHEGNTGSPPVEFYIYGEELRLRIGGASGPTVWKTPLVRGEWQDFIFHVKWSPKADVGFVELWHNGQLVLPRRHIATQYSGMLNYLKVGLYRNSTLSPVGVVYHDGWVQARNLEDVLPTTARLDPVALREREQARP
ncbi:MAG TPA: heparin lyase I family protein [Myxococcaceae bacterium]|nr:heparin lyase I family protein [Myxococcaceae bacterium]